jgi:hypothetical protein
MAFYGYSPPYDCHPARYADVISPDMTSYVTHNGGVKNHSSVSALAENGVTHYYQNDANLTSEASYNGAHDYVTADGERVIFSQSDVEVTSLTGDNRTEKCEAGEFRYGLPSDETTVVVEV